jgi:hypothetical protein
MTALEEAKMAYFILFLFMAYVAPVLFQGAEIFAVSYRVEPEKLSGPLSPEGVLQLTGNG